MIDSVFRSEVSQDILLSLMDSPKTRRQLVDELDRSKSSIYECLKNLRENEMVTKLNGRKLSLTSFGTTTCDILVLRKQLEEVLSKETDYWKKHDLSSLPQNFRCTLGQISDYEIVRGTGKDPYRVVRRICELVESSSGMKIITAIYHDGYIEAFEKAMKGSQKPAYLVLDPDVRQQYRPMIENNDPVRVNFSSIDYGLAVSDEEMVLALPLNDGSYDIRRILASESREAIEWAEHLFDYTWREVSESDEEVKEIYNMG